jgi:hypothetical protein
MSGIGLSRRAVAGVAVVITLVMAVAAVVVTHASSARAAATGFSYAVGIQTPGRQVILLGHVTNLVVQDDPFTVASSMTSAELKAATTALGGTPTAGIQVTKTFDQTDKAAAVAALGETKLANAGLFTNFNGVLCDHVRAVPAYVAAVNQDTPAAGSAGAITETIEIVAVKFTRVLATSTCPTQAAASGVGTTMSGSITDGGATFQMPSIQKLSTVDGGQASAGMSAAELATFSTAAKNTPPKYSFTMYKGLDTSDTAYNLAAHVGKFLGNATVRITLYSNGKAQVSWTFTRFMISAYQQTMSGNNAPVEEILVEPAGFTQSYSS